MQLAILDVNGTLFPLDAVARRLSAIGLDGQLDIWFARVLRDGFAASAAGGFAPFPRLARDHLEGLLEEHGQEATDERVDGVIAAFQEVSAHDDVEPGLRRLRRAGTTVVTLTNGTVEITRDVLSRHGLDDLVDASYDVAMAGRWKPAPRPYHYVLKEHSVDAAGAALIAVHPWDVQGAVHAGLAAGWVNRAGRRYPTSLARPHVEGDSFDSVVEKLLAGADTA